MNNVLFKHRKINGRPDPTRNVNIRLLYKIFEEDVKTIRLLLQQKI